MTDFLEAIQKAVIQEVDIKHEGGIRWRISDERKIAVLKDILLHHRRFTYIKEESQYEADLTEVMFEHTSGVHILFTWYKDIAHSSRNQVVS